MAPDDVLKRVLRGAWPSLPALLCASAAVCATALITALIAPGVGPVSVILAALLTGPMAAGLACTVTRIAVDGHATVREWWKALRGLGWFGVRQCLVAAMPLAAFLTALHAWAAAPWMLPSLIVSGACGALALLGLPAALTLGAARPRLRGRVLWICALHLVARKPLRFLAAPALAALGVWAATTWTASLLLLVPAPVALVAVAAVWTSAADLGYAGPPGPTKDQL